MLERQSALIVCLLWSHALPLQAAAVCSWYQVPRIHVTIHAHSNAFLATKKEQCVRALIRNPRWVHFFIQFRSKKAFSFQVQSYLSMERKCSEYIRHVSSLMKSGFNKFKWNCARNSIEVQLNPMTWKYKVVYATKKMIEYLNNWERYHSVKLDINLGAIWKFIMFTWSQIAIF